MGLVAALAWAAVPGAAATETYLPYEGQWFPQIKGVEDREDYCFEVQLNEGQTLKQIDDRHVAVESKNGAVAWEISAARAHDATGVEVATTIAVTGENLVMLNRPPPSRQSGGEWGALRVPDLQRSWVGKRLRDRHDHDASGRGSLPGNPTGSIVSRPRSQRPLPEGHPEEASPRPLPPRPRPRRAQPWRQGRQAVPPGRQDAPGRERSRRQAGVGVSRERISLRYAGRSAFSVVGGCVLDPEACAPEGEEADGQRRAGPVDAEDDGEEAR